MTDIKKYLEDENVAISVQALFNLIGKCKKTGRPLDILQRVRPRKLNDRMMAFMSQ